MLPRLTQLKLVMVVVGLLTFAWGLRVDDSMVRWVGIFIVAAAWVLRFWRRKADPLAPEDDDGDLPVVDNTGSR